jgi:uncharacterized alkaline shock family protein YloU
MRFYAEWSYIMGENKEYIIFPDERGSVNISEDVIAIIAANAALETEGVASLSASLGKDIADLLGKKNISKGVKIEIDGETLKIDVYIMVSLSASINKVGAEVQKAVASAIESATGITVKEVNVHVCGMSL